MVIISTAKNHIIPNIIEDMGAVKTVIKDKYLLHRNWLRWQWELSMFCFNQ